MKRTTYILIGLFVAGLCVLVGGMFVVYCLGRPYLSNQVNLQGEQITKEMPACRVVWFTQTKLDTKERSVWLANSRLGVLPSKGEKITLSYSEKVNDYLKITVMGDTLKVLFDYPMDKLPQEFKESKYLGMAIGDMQINITPDVECIINDIYEQEVGLKSLAKDSLSIDTSNSIAVDSCDLAALHIMRSGGNVEFQSGNIDNLYLELDRMGKWSINAGKCQINTEYLIGNSGYVHLGKGECKRMFWIPKKKDDVLQVYLHEKACVTVAE